MELSEQSQIKLIEDVATIKQAVLDMKVDHQIVSKLLETHDARIKELETYKNEMVGKISIIALFCGMIGWAISTAISYFWHK